MLTTSRNEPGQVADPAAVEAKVRELLKLEASDPTSFAESLADNIMEPDPVETAAFRSEQLVFKSYAASRYLIENAKAVIARRRRGSERKRATEHYMHKVGYERRILENICNGLRAQKGLLPNAPNPRRRAERRLVNENLAGDVKKGRIRELIEEEKAIDAEKKKQAKKARQAARKERRNR